MTRCPVQTGSGRRFAGACGPLREVQNEDQVFDRGSRRFAAWPCAAPGDGRRQDHRGVLEDFPGGALENRRSGDKGGRRGGGRQICHD